MKGCYSIPNKHDGKDPDIGQHGTVFQHRGENRPRNGIRGKVRNLFPFGTTEGTTKELHSTGHTMYQLQRSHHAGMGHERGTQVLTTAGQSRACDLGLGHLFKYGDRGQYPRACCSVAMWP